MDTYKDVFEKLRAREDQKILIINAPKKYIETTKTAFTNVSDSAESEIKFDFIRDHITRAISSPSISTIGWREMIFEPM